MIELNDQEVKREGKIKNKKAHRFENRSFSEHDFMTCVKRVKSPSTNMTSAHTQRRTMFLCIVIILTNGNAVRFLNCSVRAESEYTDSAEYTDLSHKQTYAWPHTIKKTWRKSSKTSFTRNLNDKISAAAN